MTQLDYDDESCAECRYFIDADHCAHREIIAEKSDQWPDVNDLCNLFVPSLKCRQVRALRDIGTSLHNLLAHMRKSSPVRPQ